MISEKICTKCNIIKPLDDFHNLKNGIYGKHSNCKQCRQLYRKELCFKSQLREN